MTEQPPSQQTTRAVRRRPALYRTVLSLGVAALAAAWLPFSVLYIDALSKHATTVTSTSGTPAATATAGHSAATATPVTTRTS